VLKRFAIPQGVLPSFLNDRKLNLTRDFSGAIVPMWNKTLYLDFQTGITKTINTELWGGAVYAAELDAFVFEDGSSLNLQFKSLKPLEINTDFVGGSAILSLVRADCIVDYPDATSCVVLGNFPSGLKKVNLVTGDTSEIVKAHSAVALTDGQLLIIEGSDLTLINAVGVQIETVSEVSGELCHHSPSTRKVTLVDGITNEWTLIDTETLSREKVVENNFESVLQAQALEQDAYLLVGISNGEIVVSRLQNSVTIFSTVLTGLSRQKVSIVLNAEKTKALVWAKFENLLYCVDIQNGQRLGRFEFESGILDLVWPEGSPLITLFDAFEVSQLNLESGHRNKIFDLPNPGISMRLSYDHKSLLVLTTLQSNSFYSTYKSGWLVQCALT
jgi:hypothetical protein